MHYGLYISILDAENLIEQKTFTKFEWVFWNFRYIDRKINKLCETSLLEPIWKDEVRSHESLSDYFTINTNI